MTAGPIATNLSRTLREEPIDRMTLKVLVAGLGRTGMGLASSLCDKYQVMGVDSSKPVCDRASSAACDPKSLAVVNADATSRYSMKRAGAATAQVAVACLGDDETNLAALEILVGDLGIRQRYALMYDTANADAYRDAGVEVVDRSGAAYSLLASRIRGGQTRVTSYGRGAGEIIEVEVLPGSSVVGMSLAELHPQRWLVAAVYREDELIVPHGDTILEASDRVLLVGDPSILPAIATMIQAGESEFPLQYGSHIINIYSEATAGILDEIHYLVKSTRADLFEGIACKADGNRIAELGEICDAAGIDYEFCCAKEGDTASLAHEAERRDVGVLVVPREPISWFSRIGLVRPGVAKILDAIHSPVLVARGTFPYERILLPVFEPGGASAAAHLAIDLARLLGASLDVVAVHQPEIVVGGELDGEIGARISEVERLSRIYNLRIDRREASGNPIEEITRLSEDYSLVVFPYRKSGGHSITRPSVAVNLMHHSRCSAMVLPVP